jgi:hypothetical protein
MKKGIFVLFFAVFRANLKLSQGTGGVMSIRIFLAAAAAAAIIGGITPARACTFDPLDAQRDIDNAEVIFTGVSGPERLATGNGPSGQEYKTMFNPDKIFKGRVNGAVNVVQMHDTWARYIHFKPGKEYLLLAHRASYGPVVTGCSPVMALDPADARGDGPGPEYKAAVAAALGDAGLFAAPARAADQSGD